VPLTVPVIDVASGGPAPGASPRADRVVAEQIDAACRDSGFFILAGHGIPAAVIAEILAGAREFFALSTSLKLSCVHPQPNVSRGYGRMGGEAQAAANEARTPPDLSETFAWGLEPIPDDQYHRAGAEFFPPNVWPAERLLPGFRSVAMRYWEACDALVLRLARLCALALDLEPSFFVERVDRSIGALRANHYPALDTPPLPGQSRGGPHTDYGFLTLLATDGNPGLEIRDDDGGWHRVAAEPGTFVVNIADLLSRWTNGRWRSTWHRVVPPDTSPPHPARLSLAFFSSPNWDTVVRPLDNCVDDEHPARFEPVDSGRFMRDKLTRLYAVER
jgi:isopenicillin N synthase-like dioxygenase